MIFVLSSSTAILESLKSKFLTTAKQFFFDWNFLLTEIKLKEIDKTHKWINEFDIKQETKNFSQEDKRSPR